MFKLFLLVCFLADSTLSQDLFAFRKYTNSLVIEKFNFNEKKFKTLTRFSITEKCIKIIDDNAEHEPRKEAEATFDIIKNITISPIVVLGLWDRSFVLEKAFLNKKPRIQYYIVNIKSKQIFQPINAVSQIDLFMEHFIWVNEDGDLFIDNNAQNINVNHYNHSYYIDDKRILFFEFSDSSKTKITRIIKYNTKLKKFDVTEKFNHENLVYYEDYASYEGIAIKLGTYFVVPKKIFNLHKHSNTYFEYRNSQWIVTDYVSPIKADRYFFQGDSLFYVLCETEETGGMDILKVNNDIYQINFKKGLKIFKNNLLIYNEDFNDVEYLIH